MIESARQEAADAAVAILANSSVSALRMLRVDRNANHLQLSGHVRSFYHKQLAQETVRSVAGGLTVVNRVDVRS